jgi:ribose transport system substrate-binding protein
VASQADAAKIKIGFLPGVVDPFYQVMQLGVETAAKDLGVDVVTQIPPTWGVNVQTPILDSMVARGDLNYIITAPTDKDQMVGPLKAAVDAGIKVITVDTFLGNGDYVDGPVKFPISYIGSDNVEGGRISARGLAKAIGGEGVVYINSTNPNVSSVEGREKGFKEVMEKEFPKIKVLGPDYNLDDPNKATQQTAAVLEREPKLGGVFGTNVFSAQGAGTAVVNAGLGGHVQVVAYDATKLAIELMGKGVVTLVLAQKPFDMGYMAVQFAVADAAGVTSLPRRVETGFAIINKDNVKDPQVARFIYQVPGK